MRKLFENKGGNKFKLLTEDIGGEQLVTSGLKKVFQNAEGDLSYGRVEGVGLGYIKDVSTAQRVALETAREIAGQFGYTDDPNTEKFVKGDSVTEHEESDVSNPEEKREVEIGKEILNLVSLNDLTDHRTIMKISELAQELIKMHDGDKKPYSGSPFLGGGHGGL